MTLIKPSSIKSRANKLSKLYDLTIPYDLMTLTVQDMESIDIKAQLYDNITGKEKKEAVIELIKTIASKQNVEIDFNYLDNFIDFIIRASKRDFALNRKDPNED